MATQNENLAFSEKYGKLTFDGMEEDFSQDDYKGYLIQLENCGQKELVAILKSNAYNSKKLIQRYFSIWEDMDWSKFNGDYDSLIRCSIEIDGSFNTTNFRNHFI